MKNVSHIDIVMMDDNYTFTTSYFHLSFWCLGLEKRNKWKTVTDFQTMSFRKGFNFPEGDLSFPWIIGFLLHFRETKIIYSPGNFMTKSRRFYLEKNETGKYQ